MPLYYRKQTKTETYVKKKRIIRFSLYWFLSRFFGYVGGYDILHFYFELFFLFCKKKKKIFTIVFFLLMLFFIYILVSHTNLLYYAS